jgi:hypothetical protein
MPSKGLLSSTLIATKPSAGTDTERPDIRCCVPAQPGGAFRVTVKVAGSPGLARGALAFSASSRVYSINPQPATGAWCHQRLEFHLKPAG